MDLLNISCTETDEGLPCLCICNDVQLVLNNRTFVRSFITYVEDDMVFKIPYLSGCKITFAMEDNSEGAEILSLYFNRNLVGYVSVTALYMVMQEAWLILQSIKQR